MEMQWIGTCMILLATRPPDLSSIDFFVDGIDGLGLRLWHEEERQQEERDQEASEEKERVLVQDTLEMKRAVRETVIGVENEHLP